MDYYKDNSNPLIKVNLMELEPGHIYVDEQGHRFLYGEGTNGQPSMDVIQYSELSQGVMLDDLIYSENREYTKKLVGTYWSLMRNRRKQ
jgi:hypothetical protein